MGSKRHLQDDMLISLPVSSDSAPTTILSNFSQGELDQVEDFCGLIQDSTGLESLQDIIEEINFCVSQLDEGAYPTSYSSLDIVLHEFGISPIELESFSLDRRILKEFIDVVTDRTICPICQKYLDGDFETKRHIISFVKEVIHNLVLQGKITIVIKTEETNA